MMVTVVYDISSVAEVCYTPAVPDCGSLLLYTRMSESSDCIGLRIEEATRVWYCS